MITSGPLNVVATEGMPSYMIHSHQAAHHDIWNVMSPYHISTVASYVTGEQSLSTWQAIHPLPPSVHLIWLNHGFHVNLQTCSIAAPNCISKLAQLWPPSVSPDLLNNGLQVRINMTSKCISKLSWLPPADSYDHGLQVCLRSCSITALKCISDFTWSSFSGASRIALTHRLQPVHTYHV